MVMSTLYVVDPYVSIHSRYCTDPITHPTCSFSFRMQSYNGLCNRSRPKSCPLHLLRRPDLDR